MNTKTLIQKIKQNYQPFHPETNNNISAWAYYIENALDAEETVRNDKRVFYFEIYTDSQIKYIWMKDRYITFDRLLHLIHMQG